MRPEVNYKKKTAKQHRHGEAELHAAVQAVAHQRNQRGKQNITENKRHSDPKSMGYCKRSSKEARL